MWELFDIGTVTVLRGGRSGVQFLAGARDSSALQDVQTALGANWTVRDSALPAVTRKG
jgi:hypothetical protein